MTKRCSRFKRSKGDFYATPEKAVLPLLPHLEQGSMFLELCAGDGALIDALEKHGMSCLAAFDIDPKRDDINVGDILSAAGPYTDNSADYYITNPPWTRSIMHPIIETLSAIKPTWLLYDADWMHTIQATSYLKLCHKIVSVGRVSWMGNGISGMDNAAWYLFDANTERVGGAPQFIGRTGRSYNFQTQTAEI